MTETLKEALTRHEIDIDSKAVERIEEFYELLMEKNRVMDLTNITEPREVALRHMADSLYILKYFNIEGKKVIDIGTGAGFPAMPLLMAVPSLEITMLDSTGKRMDFIREAIEKIGDCPNATVVTARAEELAMEPECREQYDIVLSRAVANMTALSELCLPYVKKGGLFVAMKSDNDEAAAEIKAAEKTIALMGGRILDQVNYQIDTDCPKRRLVVVEKTANTPSAFPRKYAKIKAGPPKGCR